MFSLKQLKKNINKIFVGLQQDNFSLVEYGKFVQFMDIEGNKIELWEPNDIEFEKPGEKIGAKTTK